MLFLLQQLLSSIISYCKIIDMKPLLCLHYCVLVFVLLIFSLGTAQVLDDDFGAVTGNADDADEADVIASLAAEQGIPNPNASMVTVAAQNQDDNDDNADDTTTTTTSRRTSTTSTKTSTTSRRTSTTSTRTSTTSKTTPTTSTKRTTSTSSTKSSTSTASKNTATSSKSSKTQASSTTDGDEIDEDAASLESGSAGSHAEINGATSSSSSGSSLSTAAKVGASVGGSVGGSGIICVFAFVFVSRRRRKHQKAPDNIVLEAEAPPSEAGDLELGGTNEEPSPSEESPAERVSIERPAAFDRQTLNPQINHIELPPHYDDLPENKVTAVIDIKEKD